MAGIISSENREKRPRINSKVEKEYSEMSYRTGKKCPPKTIRLKQR